MFDNPLPATPATEGSTSQHQAVATEVAEAGTVLLKNDDHVLPLSRRDRSIALIGPTGDDAVFVSGGSAGVPLADGQAITPAAGITSRAEQAGANVTTVQGSAGDVASPNLVDPSVLTPSSGTGPGLLGQYWSNGDFTGAPTVTEVDQHVDVTNPHRSARYPQFGLPSGPGRSRPPRRACTGSRFRGRNRHTQDRRTDVRAGISRGHSVRRRPALCVQGTVHLTAGQRVPVEVDYSSSSGLFSHEIHFGWQRPSESGIAAAVAAARRADVAVVFANDAQGEGMDRNSLSLPGDQNQLIDWVARAYCHTTWYPTGGPVLMPWLNEV